MNSEVAVQQDLPIALCVGPSLVFVGPYPEPTATTLASHPKIQPEGLRFGVPESPGTSVLKLKLFLCYYHCYEYYYHYHRYEYYWFSTAPLSNSGIINIIWFYIALSRTPNADCCLGGAVPKLLALLLLLFHMGKKRDGMTVPDQQPGPTKAANDSNSNPDLGSFPLPITVLKGALLRGLL